MIKPHDYVYVQNSEHRFWYCNDTKKRCFIKDVAGNVINIAHSTSEMHEFTSGREEEE